jgi:hypothetical protein
VTPADRPGVPPLADVALDPAGARDLLTLLGAAADLLRSAEADTRSLAAVRAPGDDPASRGFNDRLALLFGTGAAHLGAETAFLHDFIEKVGESVGRLSGQDAAAAGDLRPR